MLLIVDILQVKPFSVKITTSKDAPVKIKKQGRNKTQEDYLITEQLW